VIKFLVPFDVCNYCTLIESVEWVTYKSYPVAHFEDNDERFYEPSTYEAAYEDREDVPSELDKEFESIYASKDPISPDIIKELSNRRTLEINAIEEKYQSDTEEAKHEIFLALKKGELTAYGVLFDKMKDGFTSSQWKDSGAWVRDGDDDEDGESSIPVMEEIRSLYSEDIFLNEKKVQKIPKSHWKFDGISWHTGKSRSPDGRYIFIHFDFNELIQVFKEDDPEFLTVEKI
jgi:hypothetical protein